MEKGGFILEEEQVKTKVVEREYLLDFNQPPSERVKEVAV